VVRAHHAVPRGIQRLDPGSSIGLGLAHTLRVWVGVGGGGG
jgi:hypothetical protein